ncbi:hypothetical protein Trydic_g11500 [Trypoxylus dichotomus]
MFIPYSHVRVPQASSGRSRCFGKRPKSRPSEKRKSQGTGRKVRKIIAYDPNSTVGWIVEELNMTRDMVHEAMRKDLNKRKVGARFVPRTLTGDQKIARIEHCEGLIKAAR